MRTQLCATLLLMATSTTPVSADEVVLGVGRSFFNGDQARDSAVLTAGYRREPFDGRFLGAMPAFAVGVDLHTTGDIFVGAGAGLRWSLGEAWFVDLSVMPGFYHDSRSGNDLGGSFQFRSSFGLGYRFDNRSALSLAITHKSNAHLNDVNPGVEELVLRWHMPL